MSSHLTVGREPQRSAQLTHKKVFSHITLVVLKTQTVSVSFGQVLRSLPHLNKTAFQKLITAYSGKYVLLKKLAVPVFFVFVVN